VDETRKNLVDNTHMGIYTKVHFLCEERFWADKKANTHKYLFGGMNANGPLVIFADGSYPQGRGDTAMIVGFLIPPSAVEWNKHSAEERRQAAASELNRMMTKNPTGMGKYETCEYRENRWEDDPWGKGVTVVVKSGTLHLYGSAFVKPQGRIHFAGSDSSPIWHGYMEGALYSGERAAGEVATLLKKEKQSSPEPSTATLKTDEQEDDDMSEYELYDGKDEVYDEFSSTFSHLDGLLGVVQKNIAGGEKEEAEDEGEERFLAKQHLQEAHKLAKKHRVWFRQRQQAAQARFRARLERKANKANKAGQPASIQPL